MQPNTRAPGVLGVLLISPLEIPRRSLRSLLESRSDFQVEEAASCGAALEPVRPPAGTSASVILFDHRPESSSDMELLPQVMQARGNVPLLILSGTRDSAVHCAFMRLRVMGVVLDSDPVDHLFRAIDRVSAREIWFEHALITGMLAHLGGQDAPQAARAPAPQIECLTSRETDVIKLVGEALSNREIARRLFISETTVRHHLNSVFGKLGVASRLELMKYAFSSGLVAPTSTICLTDRTAHSA